MATTKQKDALAAYAEQLNRFKAVDEEKNDTISVRDATILVGFASSHSQSIRSFLVNWRRRRLVLGVPRMIWSVSRILRADCSSGIGSWRL